MQYNMDRKVMIRGLYNGMQCIVLHIIFNVNVKSVERTCLNDAVIEFFDFPVYSS